jgi:uroporphyrinogen III methyltransferase/synthase
MGPPQKTARARGPLSGKRVLVTRATEQSGGVADLLRDRGADPVVVPTIVIRPPVDPGPLGEALRRMRSGGYDWVLFTSANGVLRTWEALGAGADARALSGARIAVVGPATARALEVHGLVADVVAREFRGEGLAEALLAEPRAAGRPPRALLARAAKARDVLPAALREAGWEVDVVAAYETHPPGPEVAADLARRLEARGIDAVVFTSGSTVDHLCDLLGERAPALLSGVRIASIGPVTSVTASRRGLRVDITAAESTVPGLVQALEESWA